MNTGEKWKAPWGSNLRARKRIFSGGGGGGGGEESFWGVGMTGGFYQSVIIESEKVADGDQRLDK